MKEKNHIPFLRILNNQKGVSAILVAILLPVLIGFAALAIDVGYMYTTKNELQNIADAAALAGAGELGRIYLVNGKHDPSASDDQQIKNAAKFLLVPEDDRNKAAGESITPIDADIEIGVWIWQNSSFETYDVAYADKYPPDAVRVTARTQGPVSTFFAKIINFFDFEISAVATAALSGPASVVEGALTTPFGISYAVFDQGCTDEVTFNSAQDNLVCTAWHNFFDPKNPPGNSEALDASEKMLSFINADVNGPAWLGEHFTNWSGLADVDDQISPEVSIGDFFNFDWGVGDLIGNPNSANTLYFNQLIYNPDITGPGSLYETYYTAGDGNTVPEANLNDFYSKPGNFEPNPMSTAFHYWRFNDGDGDNSQWSAVIPVYGKECATSVNASNPVEIVGFADIVVTAVYGPPSSSIDIKMDCNMKVIEGRGGGGNFGNLKGSIPGLVE